MFSRSLTKILRLPLVRKAFRGRCLLIGCFSDRSAKFNFSSASEAESPVPKLISIIKSQTSEEELRKYLILCVEQSLKNADLYRNIMMKLQATASKDYANFVTMTRFWHSFFKGLRVYEKDPEMMSLFKDLYKHDIEILSSKPEAMKLYPSRVLMIIKAASFLLDERLSLLEFASKFLLKNIRLFTLKDLIYFTKDFSFLFIRGSYYQIYQYFPENPETIRMATVLLLTPDLILKERKPDFDEKRQFLVQNPEIMKERIERYSSAYNAVRDNQEFWQIFEQKLQVLEFRLDERYFIDSLIMLKRNEITPEKYPSIFALIQRIFRKHMYSFTDESLKAVIYNLSLIGLFGRELGLLLRKLVMTRMDRDLMDVSHVGRIIRNFHNKNMKEQPFLYPEDPFFDSSHRFLMKNMSKLTIESGILAMASFAFYHRVDLEVFDGILKKVRKFIVGGRLNMSEELVGILMRAMAIFQLYDNYEDIWKAIEQKIYIMDQENYFTIYDKNNFFYTKIMQPSLAMIALILERPQFIEDMKKFRDLYERLKNTHRKGAQEKLVQGFNPNEIGTFSVYHLVRAMGLYPIPEQMIEIFNVDMCIPNITIQKLDEIRKSDMDKIIERITDLDSINSCTDSSQEKYCFSREEEMNAARSVEGPSKKDCLLIEINGPDHYLSEEKYVRGGTITKERLIRKMGYRLLVIPYSECLEFQRKASRREIIFDLIEKLRKAIE